MLQKSPKSAMPNDIEIGQRIRLARNNAGMSQTALGEALGVTFQQVQKYEKGTNRVSGSRLVAIAEALGVSVASLIPGADETSGSLVDLEFVSQSHIVDLHGLMKRMTTDQQRAVVNMAKAAAPVMVGA